VDDGDAVGVAGVSVGVVGVRAGGGGGWGVAEGVPAGDGVAVGGTAVPAGDGVAVGGMGVPVGAGVAVGRMGVLVGDGDGDVVEAEGAAVVVSDDVAVGETGVAVGEEGRVEWTGVSGDGVGVVMMVVGTGVAVPGSGPEVTVDVKVDAAAYLSVETGVRDGFGEQDGLPNRSHPPIASSAAPMNSSISNTPNQAHNGLRCTVTPSPVSLERHVVDEQVAVYQTICLGADL
jgi:hypothetical protein